MFKLKLHLSQTFFLLVLLFTSLGMAPRQPAAEDARFEGQAAAPEFPEHLEWLNTSHPFSLKDLRGKMVLLDFWTYCCINCMHVIPDLKKLEEKYSKELVVIGVHSAKFFNEKGTESIRQAILRYGIQHPVINDKDLEVWELYGIQAWPSLVLINPNGRVIASHSGEQIFEPFDSLISQAIPYFEKKGDLKRSALKLDLEAARQPEMLLSFPGKIYADAASNRLFISDSNHHRILVSNPQGTILDTLGSGVVGQKDGSFETAELNHPQGTFLEGDILYIADTENHLIRAANLKTREVKTLLGTGRQSDRLGLRGVGTSLPLNSPWDLAAHHGALYIAMAGAHQIYRMDLKTLEAEPYAGSGREARIDGPLLQAALAQPSGITLHGSKLYFADSEVSSIRSADLDPAGKVQTLIGEDLFEFGDVDGAYPKARLQHPLGVVYDPRENGVFVADTYNSKIKLVNPFKKTSETFAGTGTHGLKDGAGTEAQFFEPAGITVLGNTLYVADTNNHQIRVIDRKTKQVSTLQISGLNKVAKQTLNPFKGRSVLLPRRTFKEGKGLISLSFKLPKGYKFAEEAPFHIEWENGREDLVRFTSETNHLDTPRLSAPLQLPVIAKLGSDTLHFEAVIYYCREDSKLCFFDNVKIEMPVEVKTGGTSNLNIEVDIVTKG